MPDMSTDDVPSNCFTVCSVAVITIQLRHDPIDRQFGPCQMIPALGNNGQVQFQVRVRAENQ